MEIHKSTNSGESHTSSRTPSAFTIALPLRLLRPVFRSIYPTSGKSFMHPYRTHTCGALRLSHSGEEARLSVIGVIVVAEKPMATMRLPMLSDANHLTKTPTRRRAVTKVGC